MKIRRGPRRNKGRSGPVNWLMALPTEIGDPLELIGKPTTELG